jgi:Zn-dependent metalloprotease
MKQIFTLLLAAMIATHALATVATPTENTTPNLTYINATTRQLHPRTQHALAQQPAWKQFVQQHPGWKANFDEQSTHIHRAFGQAFAPQNAAGTPEQIATNFLKNDLKEFSIPTQNLTYKTTRNADKTTTVVFVQNHAGIPITNSEVAVRLTKNNEVLMFTLDFYDNISLSTTPDLTTAQAIKIAEKDVKEPIINTKLGKISILPLPQTNTYNYALVQEMWVNTLDASQIPAQYYTLVDVQSGKVLFRQNKVAHCTHNDTHQHTTACATNTPPPPKEFNVKGYIYPLNQFTPVVLRPMPEIRLFKGLSVFNSDTAGRFSITPTDTLPYQIKLQGKYCIITNVPTSSTPSVLVKLDTVNNTIILNGASPKMDNLHLSAYYHTNQIHKYMKSLFPTFTGLDFALPTAINLTSGSCNAFYDGNSINFYAAGGGCVDIGQLADVVYHEYGHAIHDKMFLQAGSQTNGGLGEGYGDIFGLSLTLNPKLGIGFFGNTTAGIRSYDTPPKIYPRDLTGEVHDNGEIICGAFWDFIQRTNVNTFRPVFKEAFLQAPYQPEGDEGRLYTDILIDMLIADDNDNNLNNGTPHAEHIVWAFARHGITLFSEITTIFTHYDLTNAPATQPINLTADVITDPMVAPFLSDLELSYKTNANTTWQTISMTNGGSGTVYYGAIPPQPAGTLITYYIGMKDVFGNVPQVYPIGANDTTAATLPYYILVGMANISTQDFENATDWKTQLPTDNASGGRWIIDTPIPSTKSGQIVQTGTNFSAVGTKCAITGNASGAGSNFGAADVDNGTTTLQSPRINLSGMANPTITYRRWYTNNMGTAPNTDNWVVQVSKDSTNWITIENTPVSELEWRRFAFRTTDYLPNANQIWVRFVASDLGTGSIVEAAVDEFQVWAGGLVTTNDLQNQLAATVNVYPNPAQHTANTDKPKKYPTTSTHRAVQHTGRTGSYTKLGQAHSRQPQRHHQYRKFAQRCV